MLDAQRYPNIMMMIRRCYISKHGLFLAQAITEGVRCVVDMRCSCMYCVS